MSPSSRATYHCEMRSRRGFTLVEMLVVVGIIAVLVGVLLPAIGTARKSSLASKSQANLKQWGSATINYTSAHKEQLPWEGSPLVSDMAANLAEQTYWANVVAILAGEIPYSQMVARANANEDILPVAPAHSLFCDPGAISESDDPWPFSGGAFFFSYVPNQRLNDAVATDGTPDPKEVIKTGMIADSAATVLMMELRARPSELPSGDPYYGEAIIRNQSDWRCFPNHHFEGGHVVFADGHTAHVLNDTATRSAQNNRDPAQAGGDWNRPGKMIWNPQGPAPYPIP